MPDTKRDVLEVKRPTVHRRCDSCGVDLPPRRPHWKLYTVVNGRPVPLRLCRACCPTEEKEE